MLIKTNPTIIIDKPDPIGFRSFFSKKLWKLNEPNEEGLLLKRKILYEIYFRQLSFLLIHMILNFFLSHVSV